MIMSSCDFKLHSRIVTFSSKSLYHRYSPLLFKAFGIWVVLYTSTMNIYFSELSVYIEAIINTISPSLSTFSSRISTSTSRELTTKVCGQSNRGHECSEGQKTRVQASISSFTYPFSNPVVNDSSKSHGNTRL